MVVGERGRILLSKDYGKSWHEISNPAKNSLLSVSFNDKGELVAVGIDEGVYVSRNNGVTWSPRQLDFVLDLQVKAEQKKARTHLLHVFWSGDQWIASGTNGVIAHSADGQLWTGKRLDSKDRNWYTSAVINHDQLVLSGSRFFMYPIAKAFEKNSS